VLGQSPSVTDAAGIVLVMGSVLLASRSMTGP
jgi:drug/metabolite transporter (DMT)-like permease